MIQRSALTEADVQRVADAAIAEAKKKTTGLSQLQFAMMGVICCG